MVIVSGSSPLRNDALVVPSVTYGPNRPDRTTTGADGLGVVAELAQRRRRRAPAAPGLGLREQRQRLVERHRQQLFLGLEAARVGALLHVGPEATVEGLDLLTRLGVGPDGPGQAQQLERLVQAPRSRASWT